MESILCPNLEGWAGNKGSGEEGEGGGEADHHRVTCQDSSPKSEPASKYVYCKNRLSAVIALEIKDVLADFLAVQQQFPPVTYFEMTTPERRMPTTEERAFVKPPEFPGVV